MKNLNRYNRQIILPEIGEIGQQKLMNAKVLVIGAGGLGCTVLQNLTIAGIGTIGIIDGDTIEITNLHRQVLYSTENIGEFKVNSANKALKKLNEDVSIKTFNFYLDQTNAEFIFKSFDIIIDCTDNIATRYLINDSAIICNKTFVYAAIHKFQGQVSVFNYNNGPSYRCLFPENESEIPSCDNLGVLGVLPNIIGTFQANEAIKIILSIGNILSSKLLIYDALSCETQIIEFDKNQVEINNIFLISKKSNEYLSKELDFNEFKKSCANENILKIDLREMKEDLEISTQNLIKLPLESFLIQLDRWEKTQNIVIFCKSGIKSKFACDMLVKEGFTNVSQLKGGFNIHL